MYRIWTPPPTFFPAWDGHVGYQLVGEVVRLLVWLDECSEADAPGSAGRAYAGLLLEERANLIHHRPYRLLLDVVCCLAVG